MAGRKQFAIADALDDAVSVFWELGPATASVSDLTAGTGLSRSSLYATFGDRDDLLVACLDRYGECVASVLLNSLRSAPTDPAKALNAMYTAILQRMADAKYPAGCLITSSLADIEALSPKVQAAVRWMHDGQLSAVREVLEAGLREGWRHERPIDHTVAFLVGTAQTLAVLHRAGTSVEVLRGIADAALTVLD